MKPYSNDLRSRIVEAYENGEGSIRELSGRFSVSFMTVWRLLVQYQKTGKIDPQPHAGGNPGKIDETNLDQLHRLVIATSDATVEELQHQLEETAHIIVSRSAVGRALLNIKLTIKKTMCATEQDTEKVKEHEKEYQAEIATIVVDNLVFIDESGTNIAMYRKYARSLQGERVYGSRPSKRGGNVTILGALSLKGLVASMTVNGAANGPTFLTYIRDVLAPQLHTGQVVVMDNLNIHKMSAVRQAIEAVGARLIYLPEYSPELNPIEECWSKVKSILRSIGARTREYLDGAITRALASITSQDALGWFAHAGYCIQRN